MRAVHILSKKPGARVAVPAPTDQRGHDVTVNPTGSYAFCKKCFVTRRIRDKKWLWVKRCKYEDGVPRSLGERWQSQGHEVVLEMTKWKILAERPGLLCVLCEMRVWATAGFKRPCEGDF